MSDLQGREQAPDDIEQLLPWFVTGKLDEGDRRRVEDYLEAHPAMRAHVSLVEAEQLETIHNNEAIGAPASDSLAKLMARIEGDPARGRPLALLANAVQTMLDWLGERSALVPVTAAAVVALLLQAGVIASLLWHPPVSAPTGYQTASAPAALTPDRGTYLLAGFAPAATSEQIEHALQPLGITIVDGPKAGGIYRLRLSERTLGETERDMLTTALKSNSGVLRFVAPATP